MALELRKADPETLAALDMQSGQAADAFGPESWGVEQWAAALGASEGAEMYVREQDGIATPIAAGGFYGIWPGRYSAWIVLSGSITTSELLVVVRRLRERIQGLIDQGAVRIEATARRGFAPAARLLRRLGFEYEGTMRQYAPDGSDHLLFAIARPH